MNIFNLYVFFLIIMFKYILFGWDEYLFVLFDNLDLKKYGDVGNYIIYIGIYYIFLNIHNRWVLPMIPF